MDILEAIQYKAGLIVSGCWKWTNRTKLYAELGWEGLSDRCHIRRLMFYYRINAHLTPSYSKNCVDYCPQPLLFVLKIPFSLQQESLGPSSCQCSFYPVLWYVQVQPHQVSASLSIF